MGRKIDYSLRDIYQAWIEHDKNTAQTARALGIGDTTVRRKLTSSGVFVPRAKAEPKSSSLIPKSTFEPIKADIGMNKDAIREKFKLEEGQKVWVLNDRNRPVLVEIEKVNKHNIATKNKYGRTECFTYGDILTGYCAKTGKRG